MRDKPKLLVHVVGQAEPLQVIDDRICPALYEGAKEIWQADRILCRPIPPSPSRAGERVMLVQSTMITMVEEMS